MTDFHIIDHGSIAVLSPLSVDAKDWCDEHLPEDAQRWGGGYVVEPRYLGDIVDGACADGLTFGGFNV